MPFVSSARASSGDSTTTVESGPLAHRPDHLDVVAVADERDEVAAVGVAPRLGVHLRDERADRVDDAQAAALAVLEHGRRDTVGREDADRTLRDFVLVVDEHGAEPLEAADDVVVVDDVVADVDRRAVLLEQPLDDLDRAVDAGAERARSGEEDAALISASPPEPSSARRMSPSARGVAAGSRGERLQEAERARAAVGRDRVRRAGRAGASGVSLTARTHPRRRPVAARTPLSMSTASAPVSSCRRRRSAGIVDEPVDREDRPRAGAGDAETRALPEHAALLVDDAGRVDHGADLEAVQAAGDAERDELARRNAAPGADADTRRAEARALRGALLGRRRAGCYPVSVHAMLRTVSLTLEVAT